MTPLEQPLSLKAQSSTWGEGIPEPDWHLYTPAELTEFWGGQVSAGETVTADRARELWAADKGRKVARLEEIKAALMEERQHRLDAELGRLGGTEADLAAELAQQAAAYDMTVTDPLLAEEIREAAWEYIRAEGEWPSWYDPEPAEAQVETDEVWPDAASWAARKPQAPDPGEAERDRLIEEAAERFPEYSHLDQAQMEIDADARANWGSSYPEYEGPGYTEPPVNWAGWHADHSEFERDHYWDYHPEAVDAGGAGRDRLLRDWLIDEAAERFPEYSYLDEAQAFAAAARVNWGAGYPPYEGPGHAEPPADLAGWHRDHSEFERDHYWDHHPGLEAPEPRTTGPGEAAAPGREAGRDFPAGPAARPAARPGRRPAGPDTTSLAAQARLGRPR